MDQAIQINATIVDKKNNTYVLYLDKHLPYQADQYPASQIHCCGGYCGSLLWQKVCRTNPLPQAPIYIHSKKDFALGRRVILSLSTANVLCIQFFLWLLPTLLLLLNLSLLPSTGLGLLLALIITFCLWLFTHQRLKKYYFGLHIEEAKMTNML